MELSNESYVFKSRLTPEKILRTNFKKTFRGYDPDEVNHLLDTIILDYDSFEAHFTDLVNQVQILEAKLNNKQSNISLNDLDPSLKNDIEEMKIIINNHKKRQAQIKNK